MREIIFRGKRKDNGEWVEGCLLYDSEQNESYIAESFEDKAAYIRKIIPETVGQYTGLTDNTGRKIFEGDIATGFLLSSSPVNGVFVFRGGSFGIMWNRQGKELFWAVPALCNVRCKVIGNIHDNLEFLKGDGGK